jgi:DNA-binding PadR family transcriptional regulator
MVHALERLKKGMLTYLVLEALSAKPMYAYQLIKEIEKVTRGRYKPSPGSLYPVLKKLVNSGAVELIVENSKKTYRITETGMNMLNEMRKDREEFFQQFLKGPGRELIDVLVSVGLLIKENRKKIDEEKHKIILELLKSCEKEIERVLSE